MADPLDIVEKIVKLALSIKQALKKVRQNETECKGIERTVERISALLVQLQEKKTEMMSEPTMSGPVEDLAETLDHALELVTRCQTKQNIVGRIIKAGEMASQLRRVREDMSDKLMVVVFANAVNSNVFIEDVQSCVVRRPSSRQGEEASLFTAASSSEVIILQAATYDIDADDLGFYVEDSCDFGGNLGLWVLDAEVKDSQKQGSVGFTKFGLSELEDATHNFSDDNLIVQGDFAAIYKGVLQDGCVVVIKKIHCRDNMHEKKICKKIRLVSKLENKNIVRLLGYGYGVQWSRGGRFGADQDYVLLVEEYMANGSLDNIIYESQLDWSSRFLLAQGIARGLRYLHEQQIVHSDLKPNNVLMDSDMNPKIADFGDRARILDLGDDDIDNILAGTMGYIPPEYIMEGIVSKSYDVYSFGVILLETISGMCRSKPARHQASIEWAWVARGDGLLEELLDLSLCSESELKEVRRCMEVGLLCTQSDRTDRPTMLDVIEMLNNKKELPTPKQPKYTVRKEKEMITHGVDGEIQLEKPESDGNTEALGDEDSLNPVKREGAKHGIFKKIVGTSNVQEDDNLQVSHVGDKKEIL